MKRFGKPSFVVVLGVVLYLIATNAGAGQLYVVSAVIGAVVAVSAAAPWWNVRGVVTARHAPVLVTAGEPFKCALEVKSTGQLARHLQEVEDHFAGHTGRAVVMRVGRDRPETVRYTMEDPKRGIYTGGRQVAQVFYVEKDQPNVIFGAYKPETLFFPTSSIKVDQFGSLRSPSEISEGNTYSVISQVPNSSPDQLRNAGTAYPEDVEKGYLGLPTTGQERTRALAKELTKNTVRNAVPAKMVEEFDRLEPAALTTAERLKEAQKAHG